MATLRVDLNLSGFRDGDDDLCEGTMLDAFRLAVRKAVKADHDARWEGRDLDCKGSFSHPDAPMFIWAGDWTLTED